MADMHIEASPQDLLACGIKTARFETTNTTLRPGKEIENLEHVDDEGCTPPPHLPPPYCFTCLDQSRRIWTWTNTNLDHVYLSKILGKKAGPFASWTFRVRDVYQRASKLWATVALDDSRNFQGA